jgi:hypothetical protein
VDRIRATIRAVVARTKPFKSSGGRLIYAAVIRLEEEQTKSGEARVIPLPDSLVKHAEKSATEIW